MSESGDAVSKVRREKRLKRPPFARERPWGQSGRASFVPATYELMNQVEFRHKRAITRSRGPLGATIVPPPECWRKMGRSRATSPTAEYVVSSDNSSVPRTPHSGGSSHSTYLRTKKPAWMTTSSEPALHEIEGADAVKLVRPFVNFIAEMVGNIKGTIDRLRLGRRRLTALDRKDPVLPARLDE